MELLKCFPPALARELSALPADKLCDIRLFSGGQCVARLTDGEYVSGAVCSARELYDTAQALCGRMLRLMPECTGEGFITLRGGHRMGLCGRVTYDAGRLTLREVGSVCLRIAHAVRGAGGEAARHTREGGVLLAGPPGGGKTTMLRDAVRLLSDGGLAVGLADERSEVAACLDGEPQLDVGMRTHVIDGCKKAAGMRWLLRAMSPDILATDELYGADECAAVREAAACGVIALATAHAGDSRSLCARAGLGRLLSEGVFANVLFISDRRVQCAATARDVLEAACWPR